MFVLLFLPCFHRLVLSLRSFSLYICLSCFLVRDFLFVTPRDFAGLTSQYIRTHKTSSLYARLYEYTRLTDSSWTPLFYWFILALGISVALSLPRSTDHDRSKRVAASPAENRGSANRSIHGWLASRRVVTVKALSSRDRSDCRWRGNMISGWRTNTRRRFIGQFFFWFFSFVSMDFSR